MDSLDLFMRGPALAISLGSFSDNLRFEPGFLFEAASTVGGRDVQQSAACVRRLLTGGAEIAFESRTHG